MEESKTLIEVKKKTNLKELSRERSKKPSDELAGFWWSDIPDSQEKDKL